MAGTDLAEVAPTFVDAFPALELVLPSAFFSPSIIAIPFLEVNSFASIYSASRPDVLQWSVLFAAMAKL